MSATVISSTSHSLPSSTHAKPTSKSGGLQRAESSNGFCELENPPKYAYYLALLVYFVINSIGKLRELLESLHVIKSYELLERRPELKSFPPLYASFERFYFKNVFRRIRDTFEYPVCSAPGALITIQKRTTNNYNWTFDHHNEHYEIINMGSYNYLGFAETNSPTTNQSVTSITDYGLGIASSRQEVGSTILHRELENLVAEFLGVEAALVFPQGFATNSLNIPAIINSDSCIISDQFNHASLILGCRMVGATTLVFKHNNIKSLEEQLIKAIKNGNKKTGKPFTKILIVVEGIYSMEGSIVPLPEVISLKRRYGAYLYLDEAHSIGAIGKHGRGIVDYYGVDPNDVDILMGTFTKSFASAGGYIAGKKNFIDHLRVHSHAQTYGNCMSPPASKQIIASMRLIMTAEGQKRMKKLAWNTQYFRSHLHKMGLIVMGSRDSPVVPVLLVSPSHINCFARLAHQRGLGAAVVGHPATKLTGARVRFCLSSSHSKAMLDKAIEIIDEIATIMHLRYSRLPVPEWCKHVDEQEEI